MCHAIHRLRLIQGEDVPVLCLGSIGSLLSRMLTVSRHAVKSQVIVDVQVFIPAAKETWHIKCDIPEKSTEFPTLNSKTNGGSSILRLTVGPRPHILPLTGCCLMVGWKEEETPNIYKA